MRTTEMVGAIVQDYTTVTVTIARVEHEEPMVDVITVDLSNNNVHRFNWELAEAEEYTALMLTAIRRANGISDSARWSANDVKTLACLPPDYIVQHRQ